MEMEVYKDKTSGGLQESSMWSGGAHEKEGMAHIPERMLASGLQGSAVRKFGNGVARVLGVWD